MGLSLTKLLDLINQDNNPPVTLTENNVSVGAPVVDSGANYNTRVTVSAIAGRAFTGTVDVKYKRINLSALTGLEFSPSDFTDKASFLGAINAAKGTWLEEADLQAFTLPDPEGMDPGDIADIQLTAKTTSLSWLGQGTVSVIKPVVTLVSIDTPDFKPVPVPGITIETVTMGGTAVAANSSAYSANNGLTFLVTPTQPYYSTDLLRLEWRIFSGVSWSDWGTRPSTVVIQGNGKALVSDNYAASQPLKNEISANTQYEFRVRISREAQTGTTSTFAFTVKKNP